MYIKDGKVGSNHSDQSQVCQLHCFVTTKPNAPHMRGTPPQTDAGSPRHHRQQSGPRGATSPARGKLRTRIVWSPREVRRFRIDRLRLHGRYGRCGSGRDHQSLLACRIEPGHRHAHTRRFQRNVGGQPRRPDSMRGRCSSTRHSAKASETSTTSSLSSSANPPLLPSGCSADMPNAQRHRPRESALSRRQCNKHRASHLKRGSPAPFKEQIPRQETTP